MTALPAQALRFLRNPVVIPIYLPTLFFGMALGMIKPILPLYVADFDVSYALIGLVIGAEALGAMLADVPAGVLLRRYSEKQVMLAGQTLVLSGMLLLFLAPTVWMGLCVPLHVWHRAGALQCLAPHVSLRAVFARQAGPRHLGVRGHGSDGLRDRPGDRRLRRGADGVAGAFPAGQCVCPFGHLSGGLPAQGKPAGAIPAGVRKTAWRSSRPCAKTGRC